MEKQFVTYEQSLALKELGFDELCWCYFINDVFNPSMFLKDYEYLNTLNQKYTTYTLAPLKQQAFRWFREKYNWTIKVNQVTKNNWSYTLDNFPKDRTYYGEIYKTYEEAELACINKLIETVQQRK